MLKKIQFHKTYIILGIAFLLVLITGIGVYQDGQNKKKISEKVEYTFSVIDTADALLSALIDAETGQRGYLLTNSNDYLEPFNQAGDDIDVLYTELENLLRSNPDRIESLQQELKPKIGVRINLLQQTVDLHQNGQNEEALAIVLTNVGKESMDDIRDYISELKLLEESELQQTTSEMQAFLGQADVILFLGFLFILIAIGSAANTIRNRVTENTRLLKKIDNANINLLKSRESESLKNRFMGIVAHDLRNPLSMIKSINEMMNEDRDQLSDEHKEYVGYVAQAADQMNYLIKELLDVHKIDEGKVDVYVEEIRIYQIIKGLMLGHSEHAKEKNIDLILQDNSNGEQYKTDKSIFLQVADNLLSNAIKYSHKDTVVTITIESADQMLVLKISDQGPGIKQEEKDQLFERYSKLSNRPTAGESSTGLGLWIVKERIQALGGTIDCESVEGEGATFKASFPCEM